MQAINTLYKWTLEAQTNYTILELNMVLYFLSVVNTTRTSV